MSKVIVRIKGGLGNQLFCYAAARRLALINDAELVIDDVTGFTRDHLYRREYLLDRFGIKARRATAAEKLEPCERYRRGVLKWSSRRKPFAQRRYLEQELRDFDPRLLELRVADTVYLDGYWQSEGYFKDVESTIRQDLRLKAPDDDANRNMAQSIEACQAVAVHVRWFDDPASPTGSHNLARSYYASAVREMQSRVANPHFFLFSDNPEAARAVLDLPEASLTRVGHNSGPEGACRDLWLMSRCKNFITANSTFSWWGAWLMGHQQKVVIAPSVSLDGVMAWGFGGLIPEQWLAI